MGIYFRAAVLALLAAPPSPAEVSGPASGVTVEQALILSAEPAVVEMRTAALIMSGQQGGALPVAIAAVPDGKTCGADGTAGDGAADDAGVESRCRFTALVEVDGAALLEGSPGAGPLPVEIFAYVLGSELDVLEQQTLALDLGAPEHRLLLANTGLKAFLRLGVAPGDHQLRVLVHAGEAFGLRGLDLHAGTPPGPRIRPPIFHELIGPWLLAAPAGARIPLPPPFGLEGASPLPSARPQMAAGGSISGQVLIANAGTGEQAGDQVDPAGKLIAIVRPGGRGQTENVAGGEPVEVLLTIHDRAAVAGLESVAVSFSAPPGVGSGLWEIAVARVPDDAVTGDQQASGDRFRSGFVPIFIEPPPAAAASGSEASGAGRTVTGPKPLAGSQRKLARAAGVGYARALRQLAQGDSQAARSTLMASEEPVALALDADAVDVLLQAESRVLEPLPDAEWGCLLPVILLHLDLSRAYRESGRSILAYHATRMTVDLAGAYADKLAGARAQAEAAQALSSLAGYRQHDGALSQAERLFTRALDVAADGAALLGLATLYEKRGLFAQAVPVFERLVAERPEDAEGALRLALNRARTGQAAAAEESLGELASRPESDWIALLAHQELARLLIDDGRQSRAADVLRRALVRWPGHPTLQLHLAWVLDAQGASEASLELLEELGSLSAHPAGERSRYNRWPGDLLANRRRALAETARSRLPDLERWLSSRGLDDG